MSVITIEALTRSYGRRRGVDSLSLSIPEGALFGFLGPNGAGKTTTIRVLLGLLRATSGRAVVFGRDCWRESAAVKRDVGYIPGDLRLYPWLSGRQTIDMLSRIRRRDLAMAADDLAERFDLDLSIRVRAMSRGTRQKLGLVLALAHAPRLLILDEPTGGLDPIMQDRLHEILRSLAAAGHTVFFSSHTLAEVERLCDRVAIIRSGRLVADESLDSLRARAGHDVQIRWKDAAWAAGPAPEFLRIEHRDGLVWQGSLGGGGDAGPLIAWLNGKPIADLRVSPPDLEALFRRYYRMEGPA